MSLESSEAFAAALDTKQGHEGGPAVITVALKPGHSVELRPTAKDVKGTLRSVVLPDDVATAQLRLMPLVDAPQVRLQPLGSLDHERRRQGDYARFVGLSIAGNAARARTPEASMTEVVEAAIPAAQAAQPLLAAERAARYRNPQSPTQPSEVTGQVMRTVDSHLPQRPRTRLR